MNTSQKFNIGRWLRSRTGLVFFILLAIAAFFLITEHRAHLFGILPYVLLLLALLVFLFIRRGQDEKNGHDGSHSEENK
jgi:hypothetical protein